MSDLSSPRLQVLLNDTTVPAHVLSALKKVTSLGLAELRALITSGTPVLDIEMFTNDWYDSGATRVLDLLARWESEGIKYTLRETLTAPERGHASGNASQITLEELRNIVGSSEDEQARRQEIDGFRYGGTA